MKFGLKSLLVTMCVVGAVIGVMTKLLIESPEMFMFALRVGSTVGPFLLAVGTIVWLGLRGKPRRRGLVIWGVLLLLTPIVVQFVAALLWPSGDPLRLLSTERLIENRLPTQADAPWMWRELERRLGTGRLNAAQVNTAVGELIAHMKSTKPNGWNQPLAWQRSFLAAAVQQKLISDKTLIELCEAFYGLKPDVRPIPPISAEQRNVQLNVTYGNPWADHTGFGIVLLWDVKQVLVDQVPVTVSQLNRFENNWYADVQGPWEPSEHQVAVVIECAYVDANRLMGTDLSRLPVRQWPRARKRWTATVTVPLKVNVGP